LTTADQQQHLRRLTRATASYQRAVAAAERARLARDVALREAHASGASLRACGRAAGVSHTLAQRIAREGEEGGAAS
jgi:hypothetical protein